MHTRHGSAALLLAIVVTVGGCADRSAPPPRSSPEPEVIAALGTASPSFDDMRAEPTWYDPETRRVLRLRGGVVEPVQDRALSEVAEGSLSPPLLRVFDDDSIALVADGVLYLYPVGGSAVIEDLASLEVALDGRSVDDLWYAAWFLADELGYRLCHRVSGATDCGVALPNVGGYSAVVAVADDGSVYVNDRDEAVLRHAGGELTTIGSIPGGVRAFRRGGGTVLALAGPGLFEVDADGVRQIDARYVSDVVVTSDGYYVATFDSELVKVDPSCEDGWLTSCERRVLWSQLLVEQARDGGTVEIAHEDCDDAHPDGCERTFYGLGVDGERVVVVGDPLRAVGG